MKNYITEFSAEGLALVRENTEGLSIKYVPGLSTASSENPNSPRERESFLREVLAPMIERGEIEEPLAKKLESLIEQNKTIARGLLLLEKYVREKTTVGFAPPQKMKTEF